MPNLLLFAQKEAKEVKEGGDEGGKSVIQGIADIINEKVQEQVSKSMQQVMNMIK